MNALVAGERIVASSFERAPWGWALAAMVLLALVRGWPAITHATTRARESVRLGKNNVIEELRDRVVQLEAKVEQAAGAAHLAEMRLVYAISAVQLLMARVRAEDPNDPILAQANELLAAAGSGHMPSWAGKLGAELATIKGAGE